MDRMADTLETEYGVKLNTSEWNERVTHDWDKAQSLVTSSLRVKQQQKQKKCFVFYFAYIRLYQNGRDQNGPQIFDMSKTAHMRKSKTAQPKYKTAHSHD